MSKIEIDTKTQRGRILGRARATLGAGKDDAARKSAVDDRLKRHGRNLVPERSNLDAEGQIALFWEQAEAVAATVVDVDGYDDIPEAIADYLRERNLPAKIKHGADDRLSGLPWSKSPTLERETGVATGDDQVSLSHAFAAVAETGTLILTSGTDNPTTLNFLPENHIVVLDAATVAGAYEDVWDKVREAYGQGRMPRTLNMVSGPSRTADVEQTIQLGAHGPRSLHVIIVRNG